MYYVPIFHHIHILLTDWTPYKRIEESEEGRVPVTKEEEELKPRWTREKQTSSRIPDVMLQLLVNPIQDNRSFPHH
jgi:hypothetical protein